MGSGGSLRAKSLRLLARREHSRAELARKLRGPDVDPAEIEALLDELQGDGSLSESRLAEQMVHAARGRYGVRRVAEKLREKGVGDDTLAQAAEVLREQDLDSARSAWRKRFKSPPATLAERAKQARFLAGRGFSGEVIRQVLAGAEVEDESADSE